eukprot:gene21845-28875_t
MVAWHQSPEPKISASTYQQQSSVTSQHQYQYSASEAKFNVPASVSMVFRPLISFILPLLVAGLAFWFLTGSNQLPGGIAWRKSEPGYVESLVAGLGPPSREPEGFCKGQGQDFDLLVAELSKRGADVGNTAGALTQSWQFIEDGDILLDTFALLHEVLNKGSTSMWARYMCTLPDAYSLPTEYSGSLAETVIQGIPALKRLIGIRNAPRNESLDVVRAALSALSPDEKQTARWKNDTDFFWKVFAWAEAATKTRTLSLDLEEEGSKTMKLAQGMQWITEMGVMIPVFDMANHWPMKKATTQMETKFKVKRDGTGLKVFFQLIACRDLSKGQEVTFSYNPNDDLIPECNWRWLIEYGFVIEDGVPGRDCYAWDISSIDVVTALYQLSSESKEELHDNMNGRISEHGLESKFHLATHGELLLLDHQPVKWIASLTGIRDEQAAAAIMCQVVRVERRRLQEQLSAAELEKEAGGGLENGAYARHCLLTVMAGA